MFTDRFFLKTGNGNDVLFKEKDIAVQYSIHYRYINPRDVTPGSYYYENNFFGNFIRPKDWQSDVWDEWWSMGGMESEMWQNWMFPSPKTTFRKLTAIIDDAPEGCRMGTLCKGSYTLEINYRNHKLINVNYRIEFKIEIQPFLFLTRRWSPTADRCELSRQDPSRQLTTPADSRQPTSDRNLADSPQPTANRNLADSRQSA
ncbi:unnamed protein product [Orchesella dallaii]|uniref:Uncharacterized protein n=1 Tax=Orchesella dallaii TaxID=48710 RepID=A0ABP1S7X9_9HEXA